MAPGQTSPKQSHTHTTDKNPVTPWYPGINLIEVQEHTNKQLDEIMKTVRDLKSEFNMEMN